MEEANRKATEDKKLCNRTAFAIDYLYKFKDMSHLIKALIDLGNNVFDGINGPARILNVVNFHL